MRRSCLVSDLSMKVVILAGGMGSRLAELTDTQPKPMISIGGKPIIWHIMKLYSFHGFDDFVILLGYKGWLLKEYFTKYFIQQSDITVDLRNNDVKIHENFSEPWRVTLVDTGMQTMTGGRIQRARRYVGDEAFLLTYGDGLSDVNVRELVQFHQSHGKIATVTCVQAPERFGVVQMGETGIIHSFQEKPKEVGVHINGGFFVCQPQIFDYISNDSTVFEKDVLEALARDGQLMGFEHSGFWQCMDTLSDHSKLQELWNRPSPPWRLWKEESNGDPNTNS